MNDGIKLHKDINRPVVQATKDEPIQDSRSTKKGGGKIFGIVIIIILVALCALIAVKIQDKVNSQDTTSIVPGDANASDYYAVFLDNNQVYFGKISSMDKEELVLTDVFYLQADQNTDLAGGNNNQNFALVKLGQELHGPTNEMYINMEHVVFYEQMKKDSTVVQSIADH